MMKLEWSPDALEDLDIIYDVIALDNADAAERFITELRAKAGNLLVSLRMSVKIEELGAGVLLPASFLCKKKREKNEC